MRIDFNFSLETDKTTAEITHALLSALSDSQLISLAFSSENTDDDEDFSYEDIEEETVEQTTFSNTEQEELRPAVNLDWEDNTILQDLHTLTAKEFCGKYDVSNATFYYNRRKRPLLGAVPKNSKHTATDYTLLYRKPEDFLNKFGYDETELPKLQQKAKEYLMAYYDNKYPGIFNVAGQFSDRIVGLKYEVSTATVCLVRMVGGIASYRDQNKDS